MNIQQNVEQRWVLSLPQLGQEGVQQYGTNLLRLVLVLVLLLLGDTPLLPGINHVRVLLETLLNDVWSAHPHVGDGAKHEPPATLPEFRLEGDDMLLDPREQRNDAHICMYVAKPTPGQKSGQGRGIHGLQICS